MKMSRIRHGLLASAIALIGVTATLGCAGSEDAAPAVDEVEVDGDELAATEEALLRGNYSIVSFFAEPELINQVGWCILGACTQYHCEGRKTRYYEVESWPCDGP